LKNARCKLLIQLSKIVLNTQDVKKARISARAKAQVLDSPLSAPNGHQALQVFKKSAQLLQGRVVGLGLPEAFTRRQSRVPKS
jgi:hypothetical protein